MTSRPAPDAGAAKSRAGWQPEDLRDSRFHMSVDDARRMLPDLVPRGLNRYVRSGSYLGYPFEQRLQFSVDGLREIELSLDARCDDTWPTFREQMWKRFGADFEKGGRWDQWTLEEVVVRTRCGGDDPRGTAGIYVRFVPRI